MTVTPLTTLTDTQIVSLTLWGEARGEAIEGRIAVGCIIRNRVRLHRFGDTFGGVCLKPWQFSCWRVEGGAENYAAMMAQADALSAPAPNEKTDPLLRECGWIAHGVIGDWILDTVKGATHYYAVGTPMPSWALGKVPVAEIGSHLFFAGVK